MVLPTRKPGPKPDETHKESVLAMLAETVEGQSGKPKFTIQEVADHFDLPYTRVQRWNADAKASTPSEPEGSPTQDDHA